MRDYKESNILSCYSILNYYILLYSFSKSLKFTYLSSPGLSKSADYASYNSYIFLLKSKVYWSPSDNTIENIYKAVSNINEYFILKKLLNSLLFSNLAVKKKNKY